MKFEHPPGDGPTLAEFAEAHNNVRLAHRRAYVEWRRTQRLTDALVRDDSRRDLRMFGYTNEQIHKIEAEIDTERFSGS